MSDALIIALITLAEHLPELIASIKNSTTMTDTDKAALLKRIEDTRLPDLDFGLGK